jgi:NAD(P)-dependent dehydrogenase (short-subunit alcohol dehydrogenase family)
MSPDKNSAMPHSDEALLSHQFGRHSDSEEYPCSALNAMIRLSRSMATMDLASHNIRVNCVCPGTVDTPMIQSIIALDSEPKRLRATLDGIQPLGRMARSTEIGEVVAFLVSDRARFMTGSIVTVDGGLLIPIAGSPE